LPYSDPQKQRECAARYASENPEKTRESERRYRENNREKTRAAVRRQHALRKVKFDAYLRDHPCATCGCPDRDVLVFHHVNPASKSFKVAGSLRAWDKVLAEIDKCVVLCGNCHMRVHRMMDRFDKEALCA
jgi:hypothetical protein